MSFSGVSSSNTATTDTSLSVGNEEDTLSPASALGAMLSQHRQLSSTRASVDSDSDYQSTGPSTGLNPSASVSRSSSFSMLSTTAQKDGVQGRRRRFYDPSAYSSWVERAGTTEQEVDHDDTTPEVEIPEDVEGSSGNEQDVMTPERAITPDLRDTPEPADAASEYSWPIDSPNRLPNIPSAPPVTLNEKIRLLRTGSVSGANKLPDIYAMSDPYAHSEANSVVSENDGSEAKAVA